ncbi:MAG: endonuclease [Prevotellaceae bacterium]|jgi:endonuclease I|nr:endonuclease [Prevotellaceae bacterium]
MKKFLFLIFISLSLSLFAQEPSGYYNTAEGKANNALRLSLQNIISSHTNVGYGGLWTVYETSDVTATGKVWDMYSTCTWNIGQKHCGNYSIVCDCINREHSLPKSWWGGSENDMYSDAFHLYPTDGKVNGQRSNFPFGECANGESLGSNALGRLGNSTFSGYSNVGTVFEPDDEYKGDFARSYFYMATCYADKNFASGNGSKVFSYSGSGNPKCNLTAYAVALFLKWGREDLVSQKEIDRNNAIYNHQYNRNPFIDHPELAEHIWGNKKNDVWYANSSSAIDETEVSKFAIYPNPAISELKIIPIAIGTELKENEDVEIFDITGTKINNCQFSILNSQFSINVSDLSSGIYIIKINNFIGKFIKK